MEGTSETVSVHGSFKEFDCEERIEMGCYLSNVYETQACCFLYFDEKVLTNGGSGLILFDEG